MVHPMTRRLTAQDWIDFGLRTLARDGFDALKADVLARKLGVSRGSFYWHFSDLGAFHARLIAHWRETATEAIIADLERHQSREERLDALLRRGFGHNNVLEIRMRAWADHNAEAARAVRDIDHRRQGYIDRMLVEAGVPPQLSATRAQLLYWAYLGAAWSRSRLTAKELDRIVTDLKQLGLGAPSRPSAVIEDSHRRRKR